MKTPAGSVKPRRNEPAESTADDAAHQYRSIWISDVHLGTRNSQAEFLLDFLRRNESEYLYLVGDIIDGWQLKSSWYWEQSHNDVIQKLLRKARKGTKVIYLPGNHDEFLRSYTILQFGGITLTSQTIHTTVDGRTFLVLHGDQFDSIVQNAKWLAHLGDHAYEFSLWINRYFNVLRNKFGYHYWSLSSFLKHKVKNAVSFISTYERTLAEAARRHKVNGVICGHIHKAEMRTIDGILYCNSGDWVESCTALVEHFDGRLEIIQWAKVGQPLSAPAVETVPGMVAESAALAGAGR